MAPMKTLHYNYNCLDQNLSKTEFFPVPPDSVLRGLKDVVPDVTKTCFKRNFARSFAIPF